MGPRLARLLTAGAILMAPAVSLHGADIFAQLGIPVQAAKEAAAAVISGGISNPGLPSAAFKLLPPAARAELATAGVAWLKTYTASAEFKAHYDRVRETHMPQPPSFEGTPEDELKRAADEQKQQAEESKQAIASLPPDQRKALEQALAASAAALARADTPEQRRQQLDAIRAGRAERTKRYEQDLASWKQEYPDNPAPLIAKRLREFLVMSADVDFAAAVTTADGRTRFANPAYEAKSSQWKMCYRAGREATTAARAAVTLWLSTF